MAPAHRGRIAPARCNPNSSPLARRAAHHTTTSRKKTPSRPMRSARRDPEPDPGAAGIDMEFVVDRGWIDNQPSSAEGRILFIIIIRATGNTRAECMAPMAVVARRERFTSFLSRSGNASPLNKEPHAVAQQSQPDHLFTAAPCSIPTSSRAKSQIANLISQRSRAPERVLADDRILVLDKGWFTQMLEGDRDALNQTFNRIVQDSRHKEVRIVEWREVPRRELLPSLELIDREGGFNDILDRYNLEEAYTRGTPKAGWLREFIIELQSSLLAQRGIEVLT